ncbi:hypothetical protein KHA80_12750 [Anaerobacillus sp. HL2]|nr:hypothetical protein KHA80_12750 [Anaerobacillus sp. HL2]
MIDVSIDSPWQDASYMIGTGPMLVKDGKININMNVASAFAKVYILEQPLLIRRSVESVFSMIDEQWL